MKRCPDCQESKPVAEFPRNRNTKDGVATYCKPCHRQRTRESLARNGGARRYHLRARYGIEPEEVDAMIETQGGTCAICVSATPTHLDHDHETGRIRGVLCIPCNNGLGLFRDNPAALRRAAEYLKGGE